MNRILVSGGVGFIGFNLCKTLLSRGDEVIAIDNLITSTGENLKKLSRNSKFTFIKHNIAKPFSKTILSRLCSKETSLNSIYHLACPTGVQNLKLLAEEMLLTSSLGTINLLELAKKNNAKFLFTSSSEVYGNPTIFPQKESYTGNVDPLGYRSPYEEGKRFAESLIGMYVQKYKIDAKIVRVFNTYGGGVSKKESRVVPKFLRLAWENKPLTIEGNGRQTRTFCYIDDLINGLILALEKGKRGEVYNLGSDIEVPIINLAKLILRLTKSQSMIKFIERPMHDHQGRRPSLEKIKRLGWRVRIPLEKGILKTVLSSKY